ncbi:MAG: FtsQ-type POTRA domain-containing protein [Clostridium butyricum]|nr:FtsQ-type POTRA domain-containing protein [Clostridium butyricum]
MAKKINKYIRKRKNKMIIVKILFLLFFIAIGFGIFACKSDFFLIKKVAILGNPAMSGEDVKEKTEYLIGQNILFIDKEHIISEAKSNAYVEDVKIKNLYPKQVNITLTEKKAIYYVEMNEKIYVLSDDLMILEDNANIENRTLVKLDGVTIDNPTLGQCGIEDGRIFNILKSFSKMIEINPTEFDINSIDLFDLMNIKVYIGAIEGKLGNDENLPDKMNKLLHIIEDPTIGIKKGYVDVGFEGSPIYYSE